MASSVPLVIGRYSLEEPIASGGMATIYFGRQVGDVGFSRLVAIKRLHPHFANERDFVVMFLDEARLASRVRHPNVVETLDVVREGDETFIVLEYVDGESLGGLVAALRAGGERMPLDVAVAIVTDLCRGLHAAHEARGQDGAPLGIVHRDVSPQNVLVGADGVARVADFGVALANVRLSQTRTGEVKGKPAYMAPEQFAEEDVTRASDIYAAGLVLWELCAGRRAYDAANEGALYVRVMTGSVPRLASVAPWVPPALADAVHRAIRRKPAERFASASDMADAIGRAFPPAPAATVGALVERCAAARLRKRREIAARLDRGAAPAAALAALAAPATPTPPAVPDVALPSARPARIASAGRREHTQTVTSAPLPRDRDAASWRAIALAVVAAGAAGVAATWWVLRGEGSSGGASTPVASEVAGATDAASASAEGSASAPMASSAEPVPPSPETDGREAEAAAPPRPGAGAPKPRRAASRPSPSASASHPCDPPWFIDEQGIRRVKRQCF